MLDRAGHSRSRSRAGAIARHCCEIINLSACPFVDAAASLAAVFTPTVAHRLFPFQGTIKWPPVPISSSFNGVFSALQEDHRESKNDREVNRGTVAPQSSTPCIHLSHAVMSVPCLFFIPLFVMYQRTDGTWHVYNS
ncbi:hypothetical protein ABZP36_024658 [Zizania latifolia]